MLGSRRELSGLSIRPESLIKLSASAKKLFLKRIRLSSSGLLGADCLKDGSRRSFSTCTGSASSSSSGFRSAVICLARWRITWRHLVVGDRLANRWPPLGPAAVSASSASSILVFIIWFQQDFSLDL